MSIPYTASARGVFNDLIDHIQDWNELERHRTPQPRAERGDPPLWKIPVPPSWLLLLRIAWTHADSGEPVLWVGRSRTSRLALLNLLSLVARQSPRRLVEGPLDDDFFDTLTSAGMAVAKSGLWFVDSPVQSLAIVLPLAFQRQSFHHVFIDDSCPPTADPGLIRIASKLGKTTLHICGNHRGTRFGLC